MDALTLGVEQRFAEFCNVSGQQVHDVELDCEMLNVMNSFVLKAPALGSQFSLLSRRDPKSREVAVALLMGHPALESCRRLSPLQFGGLVRFLPIPNGRT
jgi:hypothetical protein